jgi:hypothetical protein
LACDCNGDTLERRRALSCAIDTIIAPKLDEVHTDRDRLLRRWRVFERTYYDHNRGATRLCMHCLSTVLRNAPIGIAETMCVFGTPQLSR